MRERRERARRRRLPVREVNAVEYLDHRYSSGNVRHPTRGRNEVDRLLISEGPIRMVLLQNYAFQ